MMKRKMIICAALALLCKLAYAQNLTVDAPNLVATGENFNVTFIVEGESKPSDFSWDAGGDFQLVWGPQKGSSTSITIVNGKQTRSVKYTYTYILSASNSGKFTIPAATAVVKGESISSRPQQIEVVSNGASQSSQQGGSRQGEQTRNQSGDGNISDSDLYLRLHLSKTRPVVGEPVTATLKLYQRVDIAGFDDARFPSFDGFWSQDLTPQGDIQFVRENVNDRIYNTAVIRKYVLIPQKSGHLTIDPAELVCRIYVRTASRGSSIFDSFFDDGYTTVRKRISTPAVTMNVSALPSGAPASFGGGVGKFNISARVSKDSLSTHEAASLLVTVSGKGNISLLEAPKITFPPDFELYDVKTRESIDKSSGGISGSKTYEFPFIPRSHGDFTIPAVEYSYYDIDAGRYVTRRSDPIELKVARGKESVAQGESWTAPAVAKKGVKSLGEDIRFISVKRPQLQTRGYFFVASPAFAIVALALFLLSVLLYFLLRKLAARRSDVAGARTRKATKKALKRLRAAEAYLKSDVYSAFYEELHKAVLGFVGDKLNLPVSMLSKDNIAERLGAAGVSEELISELNSIIDDCEFARYAPPSGHDAMAAHFQKAATVISSIDSTMKNRHRNAASAATLTVLLLLLAPAAANARTDASQTDMAYIDTLWTRASDAYSRGDWSVAAEGWENIAALGFESPELYCNTGNAYFRDSRVEKAILWYERALKLDPSFGDARHNLEIADARILDDIESVPQFFLKSWLRKLSYTLDSDAWAWLCLFFFALTLAMLLMFLLSGRVSVRMAGFFSAIAALLLSLSSLAFALSQRSDYIRTDRAVLMKPVVPVKSSPSDDSATDLFVLHSGTRLRVLDNVGDWSNIELSDGRQGWLKSSSFELI